VSSGFFGKITEAIESAQQKFLGVTVGKVINQLDPMALGRVQVQLPFIDSLDLSPWARVAQPMAGVAHGTYFIPSINDEVLVAFEQGDLNAPYVIGSLWNAMSPPPLPSPLAQVRMIRTPSGNQIMFSEVPPSITIQTASGQMIVMSDTGVQITAKPNVINMTPDGITLTGPTVNINATAAVDIKAPKVTINGSAATEIQSGGVCNIGAPAVKIN
jgi:uncharacterized protein involved in type VI secretion and phage assembly